ncbi:MULTISPECIES: hypothetical protein [Sphingobium]|uniref:hypothetical protein n=1 Tax=Sphingobium TaxID=165695 RepID=UPI0015ECD19F|nr:MULTISPECIES: hypothetical protein [Sphingobium]MCW2361941.1 hypothetical protein [Sphingobium sp. B10D3B]MCW2401380.1 hypothetical protein [Sphingobium sp. B10D7B]MCW2408360.1 hypothetical protein [Sphingobium xanthum]
MPNRIYLLIALAFIIGGPMLVMGISNVLPSDPAAEMVANGGQAPEPLVDEAQSEPDAQAPPPPMVEQAPGSTDPFFDANPTLDAESARVSLPEPVAENVPAPPPPPHAENFSPQSGFGGDDGKPHY